MPLACPWIIPPACPVTLGCLPTEMPIPLVSSQLSIDVDFAFRSQLYSHVSQMFLDEVVRRMMMAFEARCAELPDTSKAVQGGAS